MRAVIFMNGVIQEYEALNQLLDPNDYLVCADGGTRHCLTIGRRPDVIVGDLDSLDAAEVAWLMERGVEVERHKRAKDETDLELAIVRAIRDGADEIVLVGALGGRLDQMLSNLLILAQRDWGVMLRVVENEQIAQIVRSGETLLLDAPVGTTVSAIPLSQEVTGITYSGLKYPLTNDTLALGSTRGISNEVVATPATIRVTSGFLLVVKVQNKG